AWLFFLNGLASMGQAFADGGIGPDASHVAAVGGTVALWTLLVSIVRLRFPPFCVALLAGIGLTAALHGVGSRGRAALGVWTVGCDAGDGNACHNAAAFYDDGGAAFGGALDATRLHKRACALGGPDTEWSCVIAREFAVDRQRGDAMRDCLHGA